MVAGRILKILTEELPEPSQGDINGVLRQVKGPSPALMVELQGLVYVRP